MPLRNTLPLIDDFLGSAQVFASAVRDIVESRLLAEVAGKQVTVAQFRLLKLVALTDSLTIGDVASFLGVSNAAASKAADKLVRRSLLRRTEGKADRRAMHLSLTPSSERLLAAYEAAKRRKLARIFSRFPAAQLRRTSELLDRLSAGLVDHSANPEELCLKCGIYFRERCLVRQLVKRNCFYVQHRNNQHRRAARRRAPKAAAGRGERED